MKSIISTVNIHKKKRKLQTKILIYMLYERICYNQMNNDLVQVLKT